MADAPNKGETKKGGSKTTPLLIGGGILIVVLVVALTVMAGKLRDNKVAAEKEPEKRNVVVTQDNVEEVVEDIHQSQEASADAPAYYTATMNTTWHFKSGSDASYDAVVENSENNLTDVFFDIVLENDEDTVLYQSPVIPRGGKLTSIALDEQLTAGTYPCVVIYHLIDEDQNTLSTVRVSLTIIVEE